MGHLPLLGGGLGTTAETVTAPDAVTGLLAWFQPSTLGANGTAVSSWTDSSGNGNHAVQATAGKQPTVETGVMNGYSGVVFDGTTDILSTGNLALSGTDDAMLYVVYADRSAGTARQMVAELGPTYEGNTNAFGLSNEIGSWPMFGSRSAAIYSRKCGRSQIATPTTPKIVACRIDRSQRYGAAEIIVNGKQESLPVAQLNASHGANFGALPLNLGAREGSGTQSLWFTGVILEAAIYSSRHVSQTKRGIEAYFAQKYGITLLPAYGVILTDGDSGYDAQSTELNIQSDVLIRRLDQSAGVWDCVDFSVSGHTAVNAESDATTQIDPWFWPGKQNYLLTDVGQNDIMLSHVSATTAWTNNKTYLSARVATGWTCFHATFWYQNLASWVLSERETFFATGLDQFDAFLDAELVPTYGTGIIDYRPDAVLRSHNVFNDPRICLADNCHWHKCGHYRMADRAQTALEAVGVAFRTIGMDTYATPVSWLKADAGLTGLVDTDPVSSWTNQGSSGVAAVGTLTARPLYRTNRQNGLPAVVFDGTNDTLTLTTIDLSATKQVTCLVAFGNVTATTEQMLHEATINTDAGGGVVTGFFLDRANVLNNLAGTVGNVGSNRSQTSNPAAVHKQPGVFAAVFDRRLSALQTQSVVNMTGYGGNSPSNTNTNAFGNDTHYIGSRGAASLRFGGDLYEDVVWDVAFEKAELNDMMDALDAKWNMVPTPWLSDLMVGTAATTLQSRTPQYGTAWTKHGSYAPDAVVTDANRLRNNGGAGTTALYYGSATPSHADEDIFADILMKSDNDASIVGLAARISTGADTFYRFVYDTVTNQWRLWKRIAGVDTELGSASAQTLTVDTEYTIGLRVRGDRIYTYVDGSAKHAAITDTGIAGPGQVGVYLSGDATNSTGLHLQHITAQPYWYLP